MNNHKQIRASVETQGDKHPRGGVAALLSLAVGCGFLTGEARAEYASAGHGLRTVCQGTVVNGALFLETRPAWTNAATPAKPYVVDAWFALPACQAVPVSRLVMTLWGGTANYSGSLGVQVNGTNVPLASPLSFGTTNDANAVFSPTAPSVYGSGSGVWLVGLPVPGDLWFKDGASNHVQLTIGTADSFDGRVNQVTLAAVYQSAALHNTFDYALAEGSGDIYRAPNATQTDTRVVPLGTVDPIGATASRLHVVYTYGDLDQNDRLYFNNTPLGGDDVSGWDKAASGLDYGPNALSLDVLGSLSASNAVSFTVSSNSVPGTRESSLRPQLAVLEVTRPAVTVALSIGLNAVIAWPVSADVYQLERRPEAETGEWTPVTQTPVVANGQNLVILPPANAREFYRLRKTN